MAFECNSCHRYLCELDALADLPLFCTHCGDRIRLPAISKPEVVAETPPAPPRFQRLRHLGSGGMGDVYEALDGVTGQRVAVKFLAERLATSPAAVEQFRNLGRLSKSIVSTYCVAVFSVDDDAGQPFIAMELLPGRTLKDVIDEEGSLPPIRAVSLILDVVEGLIDAHRFGLIHRDVKPSNCLLTADGRVKLGDFGLSIGIDSDPDFASYPLGTVLFASPEQLRGEAVGFDSDIYSVCATLYYMLSGRTPHQAESITAALAKAISEDPSPLRSTRPEISSSLERIVTKGLNRDRARRWSNLGELRDALQSEQDRKGWFARLFAKLKLR